jgi:hypothetical protein
MKVIDIIFKIIVVSMLAFLIYQSRLIRKDYKELDADINVIDYKMKSLEIFDLPVVVSNPLKKYHK